MATIALLGAGIMGREMGSRLLAAGHSLRVYNRTRARAEALASAGARLCDTPAEAASGADCILAIVADDAASRAVWLGPQGALAGRPAPSALAVESSTLSRAWVLELAASVSAAGLRYLDCPVTGGPDGVRKGALTLLAGGAPGDVEQARSLLCAFSDRLFHFGPVGCGTAYKLIVNLMGAVQAAALAEGLLVAERAGLDLAQVGEALRCGAVASPMVGYMSRRMIAGDHDDVYFAAWLRHKDAAYGLRLAESVAQDVPTSRAATALFERAVARGLGDKNSSIVIEVLREPSGKGV